MDSKITSGRRSLAAFALVEMMVAIGVAAIALTGIALFFFYSSRSFAAMANYADLDQQGQLALDNFTRQVRQVQQLSSCTMSNSVINSLTFVDYDGGTLTFSYDSNAQTLTRTKNGSSQLFLTNCTSLQFQIFQRNIQSGTLDAITTANATNCKLVQVDWTCSMPILGVQANSETVQSAKVVIRN